MTGPGTRHMLCMTRAPVSSFTSASPSNSVVNLVKPFAISYTGASAETLPVGNYTDTLTFTITAL